MPYPAVRAWDINQSDIELIAAARSGSTLALEVLVDRYNLVIQQYLVHQTGDQELAADLAQQTYLDAFRLVHRIPEDRPSIAWLYLIARNNLHPIQRRQRRFQFLSIDRLLRTISASFPALHQRDVALDAGDHDLIQQTPNQLAPGLREALLLRSVGGFTGHKVSQILDISPAAARKRISRAEHGAHRRSSLPPASTGIEQPTFPTVVLPRLTGDLTLTSFTLKRPGYAELRYAGPDQLIISIGETPANKSDSTFEDTAQLVISWTQVLWNVNPRAKTSIVHAIQVPNGIESNLNMLQAAGPGIPIPVAKQIIQQIIVALDNAED